MQQANTLPIGRQVTAFGYEGGSGLIVLELWSAAVTMNTPGVSAPDMPDEAGDEAGDDAGEQVFINLPLVRADRNAGILQLGHASNALEVRITADTLLEADDPDPNAFWQAVAVGMPVIVEGSLAADGVITANYVAILPAPEVESVLWLVLEGTASQVQPNRTFLLEGLTVVSNDDTGYALEDETNGGEVDAVEFWATLAEGDMVFVEGWQDDNDINDTSDTNDTNGTIIANFIVRFDVPTYPSQQVLDGRVINFDTQARTLDLLLDDVVMRVATDSDTSYSEQTDAVIIVPVEPVGSPLSADAFWNAVTEDALVTVYGGYGTGDFVSPGDFVGILWVG